MKNLRWVPLVVAALISVSCGLGKLSSSSTTDSGSSSASSSTDTATKCSTVECFLSNITLNDNSGKTPSVVSLVKIKTPSPLVATTSVNAALTPKITKMNGATITTTTTTTITLSTLLETTDTEPFDWEFDDPTGCTPGVCFSCPPKMRCASMACSHGKVGDGKLTGSVIQTLGFTAEPADSTTTEDLQVQVQPIVGPVDPATGQCTDPIDDSDPNNPVIVADALVGDVVTTTTEVVGADAPGGINSSNNNGSGSTGSGNSGGGSSGSGSESCQGITATCSACSFRACVTMSGSSCTGARYTTSDGGSFPCSSCDGCSAAAQNAVNHCVHACFGL